jgi:hypothetical protein
MKRWKKVALAVVVLFALSQVPFACRRYRLGQLSAAIRALEATRAPAAPGDAFDDYAGVFHVHSSLGGHSPGTLEEIVAAAKENRLAFVVMTEHPSAQVNTAEATLKGTRDRIVFINGSELVAAGGERLFVVPGFASPAPAADRLPLQELISRARAEGRLTIIAYPEQVRSWDFTGYDGIEVYNLFTNAKLISYPRLFFDGLWSYGAYPELLFATFYARPEEGLRRWDELNARGGLRLSALGGNDSHANVGFRLGGDEGRPRFEVRLDPYERSFRVVRNHVLLPKGTAPESEAILAALRAGRSYVSFDLFGDARGFRFTADDGSALRTMGEETAPGAREVRLTARAPFECRLVFFKDGRAVHEAKQTASAELTATEAGVYRVEAYLDQLGEMLKGKPWIISNPIYVR